MCCFAHVDILQRFVFRGFSAGAKVAACRRICVAPWWRGARGVSVASRCHLCAFVSLGWLELQFAVTLQLVYMS